MAVLRYATMVPVGRDTVFDAAVDPQALAGCGLTLSTSDGADPQGWLRCERPGPAAHRKPRPVRLRVISLDRPSLVAAELSQRWRWGLAYRETFVSTPAGTLVTGEMSWSVPLPPVLADLGGRSTALAALRRRVESVAALALARTPLVVAAALTRAGRVLAAQTSDGEWELPGGKVEPGERPVDAVMREIGEELGVAIAVGAPVADDLPIPSWPGRLRVYAGQITAGAPRPLVHAELRWVGVGGLDELRWRAADRLLLPHLRACLRD